MVLTSLLANMFDVFNLVSYKSYKVVVATYYTVKRIKFNRLPHPPPHPQPMYVGNSRLSDLMPVYSAAK